MNILEFANFYRWIYCLPFKDFCKYLNKPETDSWAIEKFKQVRFNFGYVLCDNTDLIENLYGIFLNNK
jgi:hypothetical protein